MANKGWGRRIRNNVQNWLTGQTPATAPAAWYVGAHTADCGDDGQTATEFTGGGYGRAQITIAQWTALTNAPPPPANDAPSISSNNIIIQFPLSSGAQAGSAPATYYSLWDHPTLATEARFLGRWPQTGTAQSITGVNQQLTFAINAFAPSAKPEP